MRLSDLSQESSRLGRTSEVLSHVYGKADTRKPQRSQEGCTLLVGHLFRQTFPSSISTHVDSDFAGCRSTRKSTTGMVQMVGEHAVKHTSNLQDATGLNVSECEYCALTHGAAHGLGSRYALQT